MGMIRRRRRKTKPPTSYTKCLISVLTILAAMWISWSYILATTALLLYGNVDPLSTVSEEVCRTVIATVIGYCVKSLAENISKYTIAGNSENVNQEKEQINYDLYQNGEG